MRKLLIIILLLSARVCMGQTSHPLLLLSKEGVAKIKSEHGNNVEFNCSVSSAVLAADRALSKGITVPQPLDNGGGYSHEKHKDNYYDMYYCGIIYQISGEQRYAQFIRDMLMSYAKMYPTLGPHPQNKPEQAGRIFWQTLNDCVWLAHVSMAYDCIYDWLSAEDRVLFETNIFRPMAEFISNGNSKIRGVFNSMHNHGTWATVSVGLIGHVMGDKDLIEKSLRGYEKDGKGGFLRQLDVLFSPDGYYMEGAYYQRYALWPFVVYAQVLDRNHPELNIYGCRNGLLNKATHAVINQSYNGELFRINDAVYQTTNSLEIINAVDAAYKSNPADKGLLDIAASQGEYVISDAGLITAQGVSNGEVEPFKFSSCFLRDGSDGTKGGVAIIRQGEGSKHTALLLKATAHGQSHGHYDKLSMLLFDNGNEILQDYGSVRYLNLEPRSGGGYTRENHTWALQTIAHNTVTVDGRSHFGGDFKRSSEHSALLNYYDFEGDGIQIVSTRDENATPGVKMQRTMAVITDKSLTYPLIIDLFKIKSATNHSYDLPFYYVGTLSSTNFGMKRYAENLPVMGTEAGYQHLWVEGKSAPNGNLAQMTWFNGNRFYSLNTSVNGDEELYFVRMGANDPNMNIRNDPGYIIRKPSAADHTFVSTIEIHGEYNLVREVTADFRSSVVKINLLKDDSMYTAVAVELNGSREFVLITVNDKFANDASHRLILGGKTYSWSGNYGYFSPKQ